MRKKLLVLSALTCIAGGSALLVPASAQNRYVLCETVSNSRCTEHAGDYCSGPGGQVFTMLCHHGYWYIEGAPS